MIKHDGSPSSLNAGEHDGSDLGLQLDVELALDKLTIDHGKVVTGYHDAVELLEELARAEELGALLGRMVRDA